MVNEDVEVSGVGGGDVEPNVKEFTPVELPTVVALFDYENPKLGDPRLPGEERCHVGAELGEVGGAVLLGVEVAVRYYYGDTDTGLSLLGGRRGGRV